MRPKLYVALAGVLVLIGASLLLEALAIILKGNVSGHSDMYFRGEVNLVIGVALLLVGSGAFRFSRRQK